MSTLTPGLDPLFDPFSVGTSSLLSDLGRRWPDRDETTAITQTNVDWAETPESHIFHTDIPGVRKNEVKVQVEDGNILHISGERMKQEETDTDTWHRVERQRGSFLRRFKLPDKG